MKEPTLLQFAGAFCLGCLGCLFLSIRADFVELPRLAVETRAIALDRVDMFEARLEAQVSALAAGSLGEIDAQANTLQGQLYRSISLANGQISNLQTGSFSAINKLTDTAAAKYDSTLAVVTGLEDKLEPTITNVNSITGYVNDAAPMFTQCYVTDKQGNIVGGNPDCLFNRYVGVAKATEQAAKDVSAMSGEFKKSMPQMIATWGQIERHVDDGTKAGAEASAATAKAMTNLSIATKPLPEWLRVVLGVGPPVAQAGAAAAAAGAALGWFR